MNYRIINSNRILFKLFPVIISIFLSSSVMAQPGGGGINGTGIDCGQTDGFSLGNNGFVGSDPTTATGSCGQCCYLGSDLDGDGDLDLVEGKNNQANTVWFNDGSGLFAASGQDLGDSDTRAVALGDLDGDGDLDLVEVNYEQPTRIYLNLTE